jgi:DNA replication protein DnaC
VRVHFARAADLVQSLAEGKLDERLKLLTQPQLLICNEIGCAPRGADKPRAGEYSSRDRCSGREKLRAG